MDLRRRDWLRLCALGALGTMGSRNAMAWGSLERALEPERAGSRGLLRITEMRATPIALPDPPLLAASGCHGPYFLRNVVELVTEGGIVGLGEMPGGERSSAVLERARGIVVGQDAFAYRKFAHALMDLSPGAYSAVEMACLDAVGKATGRRVCDLLGGPVREPVEFAAYLFYRYAADHPIVLADPHVADGRGTGDRSLDQWGEVRSPEAMAEMAEAFRKRWGFRVFKLKAGVLAPDVERETLAAMAARLGPNARLRIDPNGRWKTETAVRIGKTLKDLPMEYYEDPVHGQTAMAEVRRETGLKMSTNMCVTRFTHMAEALRVKPIDVLLADLHYFGGFAGCLALDPVCEAAGWTMSQHSNSHCGISMAAMIHLGAITPRLTSASDTHYPWLPDDADILEGPKLAIRDGAMAIPNGPGLGVKLDHDKLARANEVYKKCGMRGRDDGSLMRKLVPGWKGELL